MMKKNILWFSEINPDYQDENSLLRKFLKDSQLHVKNIRHCFEPVIRQEEVRSSKEIEGNTKVLALEAEPELLFRESYFADAVVMTKPIFQNNFYPDQFRGIHCPIVLFPEKVQNINHLLFIITSDPDSVISIKQFCSLFQQICKKAKITLLVYDNGEGIQKPEEKLVVRFLRNWNSNLGVYKEQDWNALHLRKHLEFDDKTMSVMNLNLLLKSESGSFPREIFDNDNTSLFIGFNN